MVPWFKPPETRNQRRPWLFLTLAADSASSSFIPSRDHVANHMPSPPTNRKRTRSPGGGASPPARRDARTAAATAAAAEAKPDLLVELLIAAAAKEQVRMEQHIKIDEEIRCPYGGPYYIHVKRTAGAQCGWECGSAASAPKPIHAGAGREGLSPGARREEVARGGCQSAFFSDQKRRNGDRFPAHWDSAPPRLPAQRHNITSDAPCIS